MSVLYNTILEYSLCLNLNIYSLLRLKRSTLDKLLYQSNPELKKIMSQCFCEELFSTFFGYNRTIVSSHFESRFLVVSHEKKGRSDNLKRIFPVINLYGA